MIITKQTYNKFQKYLNKDNNEYYPKEKENSFIEKSIKAAAVIGGGYLGLKAIGKSTNLYNNKTFVAGINAINRGFAEADAYTTALNNVTKKVGIANFIGGKARKEFASQLNDERILRGLTRDFTFIGKQTKIESLIKHRSYDTKQIYETAVADVWKDAVYNVIDRANVDFDDKDKSLKFIEDVLNSVKYGEGGVRGAAKPLDLLKPYMDAANAKQRLSQEDMDKAQRAMASAIQNNRILSKKARENLEKQGKPINDFLAAKKGYIKQRAKLIQSEYDKALLEQSKRRSTYSQAIENITGYQRLTVKEALKREYFNTQQFGKRHKGPGGVGLEKYDVNEYIKRIIGKTDKSGFKDLKDTYVDDLVFITKKGQIIDFRGGKDALKGIALKAGDDFQVPLVGLKPFQMLNSILRINGDDVPHYQRFKYGTIMPTIEGSSKALSKDYFYFNGKIVDEYGELIKVNQYLIPSKKGIQSRVIKAQAGISVQPQELDPNATVWDKIKFYTGIGQQEYRSDVSKKTTLWTKFKDPDWEINILKELENMVSGTNLNLNADEYDEKIKALLRTLDNSTKALDKDNLDTLLQNIQTNLLSDKTKKNLLEGNREDSILEAVNELLTGSRKDNLLHKNQMQGLYEAILQDSDEAYRPFKYTQSKKDIVAPDFAEGLSINSYEMTTKLDELEKLMESELIYQADIAIKKRTFDTNENRPMSSFIEELVYMRNATNRSSEEFRTLEDLALFTNVQNIMRIKNFNQKLTDVQLDAFTNIFDNVQTKEDVLYKTRFERIIKEANPLWGYGPIKQHPDLMQNKYIPIYESNPIETARNAYRMGGAKAVKEKLYNTLGFGKNRVGRDNMYDASTISNASYHFFFRLNEGLSRVGVGLGYKDLGSTQDVLQNLFLKRIVLPLAAINTISYINDETGNITGTRPTEALAEGYKNAAIGMAAFKDVTGLNSIGRYLTRIMPGVDLLGQGPLGMGARLATFGLVGTTRTAEETRDYYEDGVTPVRKGRFWSTGSSTPIYGDKIEYYRPNLYRRIKGDPMMTDVMYGSTSEYWANHWMPNPRNPLGFMNPFIYGHWDRKHRDDRPYPVSSTGLENIPLVGPYLDNTIGKVVMPFRKRADLRFADWQYRSELEKQYVDAQNYDVGEKILISQNGRYSIYNKGDGSEDLGYISTNNVAVPVVSATPTKTSAKGYLLNESKLDANNVSIKAGVPANAAPLLSNAEFGVNINPTWKNDDGKSTYIDKSKLEEVDYSAVESLDNPDALARLDEMVDPNSIGYRLSESYYSLTEIGGIYGFAVTSQFGEGAPSKPVLESSGYAKSMARQLWDANIGGFGGELSEIYRRFLPRNRREETYNPYRNKMPDWMPGLEYFTDFKHGDPFAKIKDGEMRLPGAGYESMNKLHPDFFGEYGALDRFKILADVAPYSEQYKYYASVVSRMKKANMISDGEWEDVQAIKKQVQQQKKKYDFRPYKFKYAEIEKEKVTVDRWINENTFLTKEYPSQPIRLAGITMPGLNSEDPKAMQARAVLEQHIASGKKITIGISKDPMQRKGSDAFGSMKAVVYDESGSSVNAQAYRAGKSLGKESVVKADFDATDPASVHALYDTGSRIVGNLWERFAHLDTPLHSKFMRVRSPIETYKREEIYGKSWREWGHPIRDWVTPSFERYAEMNPLIATAKGAVFGFLLGAFGNAKAKLAIAGGAISGGLSSLRAFRDAVGLTTSNKDDDAWIPERRRKEREINEYFDMLKYVKYKGLYEKARRLAIEEENTDPEELAERAQGKGAKKYKASLKNTKKWLSINASDIYADKEIIKAQLDNINGIVSAKTGINDSQATIIKPLTAKALEYKRQYESTLYGADPNGDLQAIYRALPKKDRAFFTEFLKSPYREREEILRLVPKNQRRIYQAKFGLPIDKKPTLKKYFDQYGLPSKDWEGWKPDVSLEEVKLRYVSGHGMEVNEFGFWKDDISKARNAPTIREIRKSENKLNLKRLREVLNGVGLEDVDIESEVEEIELSNSTKINLALNLAYDRTKEILNEINNLGRY